MSNAMLIDFLQRNETSTGNSRLSTHFLLLQELARRFDALETSGPLDLESAGECPLKAASRTLCPA